MTAIASVSQALPAVRAAAANTSLFQKLFDLSIKYFGVGMGSLMAGYGTYEIAHNSYLYHKHISHAKVPPASNRVRKAVNWFLDKVRAVRNKTIEHRLIHGVFFAGSGITAGLSAMHSLKWINLGNAAPTLNILGNIFFIISNIFVFEHNARVLLHAKDIEAKPTKTGEERSVITRLKLSGWAGVLSSACYIIGTSILLFGGSLFTALAFCGVAVSFGAFKILFDWFGVDPKLAKIADRTGIKE